MVRGFAAKCGFGFNRSGRWFSYPAMLNDQFGGARYSIWQAA